MRATLSFTFTFFTFQFHFSFAHMMVIHSNHHLWYWSSSWSLAVEETTGCPDLSHWTQCTDVAVTFWKAALEDGVRPSPMQHLSVWGKTILMVIRSGPVYAVYCWKRSRHSRRNTELINYTVVQWKSWIADGPAFPHELMWQLNWNHSVCMICYESGSESVVWYVTEPMSCKRRLFPVKDSLLVVHRVSCFLTTTSIFCGRPIIHLFTVNCVICSWRSCSCMWLPPRSLCRLVVKGYRTPLAAEDLWTLSEEDTSCKIISELQQDWTAECAKIQK